MVTLPTPVRMRQRNFAAALPSDGVRQLLVLLVAVLLTLSALVGLSSILGQLV